MRKVGQRGELNEAVEVLEIIKRRVVHRIGKLDEEAERDDDWRRKEEYYYASQPGQQGSGREAGSTTRQSPFSFKAAGDPQADVFSDLDD